MIPTEEGTPLDPRHTTSGSNGDFWGEVENEKIRNRELDKADRNTGDWYIATKNEQGIADLKIGQHIIGRAAARNHIQAFQEHNWPESDEKYFKHLAEKAGTHVTFARSYSYICLNIVSCPPAHLAHTQAGAQGGYNEYIWNIVGEILWSQI
jgi:hypothetical protein